MAAESTRIKLKRSTTAAVVPTTSNLIDGEVAVNIADRKIYVRNGGNIVEVANQKPNTGEVTTAMLATDITNGPGQTYYVAKNGSDSTTLGSGGVNGKHQDTPFLTLAKALSTATSGDTIHISAGTYTETFPLTVPDGVTVKGAGLRSVLIQPSPATKTQNGFVLSGDTIVSDLTIGGIQYDSGNDRGYAFICASNWDSTRSSYVERVTVLNRGSVTSLSDPYGYAQGDAGRGAKLDGAVSSSNSYEAAVLFNECTFFTPNQIGLYLTNGIRIEALNCFFYFASEAITGVSGATGVAGAGRTRLKLGGVSGTFSASEVIYELNNNFVTGTYSQSGTTVTVTSNSHGLSNGDIVAADYLTGTAVGGFFTVSSAATNTFVLTAAASATTSGNIQYKKALAYGTIDENDGTYVYLTNKGTGEFSSTVSNAKTAVTTGDAKLSTAQYQFGTSSLVFDGTGDFISYVTDPNFGFGLGDFTIECFARFNVVNANQGLFEFRAAAGTEVAPYLYLGSDGKLRFSYGATTAITAGNALVADTWYHIAASRTGNQTKLFVNGVQEGATFTDNNNYGSTKTLRIGSLQNAGYVMNGYIDEVRISKGTGRYTSNFTAPAAAFVEDLYTVLLLHLDGANSSTTILDSSGSTKDIRSSGGDSATVINLADYTDFGAELRSIGCAALYGNKGVVADGLGVSLRLTAVNFEYIGTGSDITNNTAGVVQANEVNELNGGRVYYTSQDQSGNFRVGDLFLVDQELGNVTFSAVTQNAQSAANITLSDGTGTTNLYPAYIETGNLRLSGNTLSSNSGQIILDPSANEDIVLNAEVISPESIFFETSKVTALKSGTNGGLVTSISGIAQSGVSSYGLFSNKNITVFSSQLTTVSIDNEGSGYAAGTTTLDVVTNPTQVATATATLTSLGAVKTVNVLNAGNDYTIVPTVSFGSGTATAIALRKLYGRISRVNIVSPGTNYTSLPALVAPLPASLSFSTFSDVNSTSDTITLTGHPFNNGDRVTYSKNSGTGDIGLTDGTVYFVKNATINAIQLSTTSGGATINLTSIPAGTEAHLISGIQAVATATISGGGINSVTITEKGSGYSSFSPAVFTVTGGGGSGADIQGVIGTPIDSITVSNNGSGYATAPSVTITADPGDTTGAGATVDSTLGYQIQTLTLNTSGSGYSVAPQVNFSGGNPSSPATATAILDKESGVIDSLNLDFAGNLYTSAPTVSIAGGGGSEATITLNILPVSGNILSSGTGYKPGLYPLVPFTGGSATVAATATLYVPGFVGTISGGTNYTSGSYTNITLSNNPTTTYTVTVANRQVVFFDYTQNDNYEWNVTNNGVSAFSFVRVSPTGTASGDDINISCEVGDVLKFNVNAIGHPFYIQKVAPPYNSSQLVTSGILGSNGTDNGTIIWDTQEIDPGTYYYVCGNHESMSGTITVSSYTGGAFQVGNTIIGSTSGASATITYVGPGFFRSSSVSGGPFVTSEIITANTSVTATTNANLAQQQQNVFVVDGSESPTLTLNSYNTYTFDISNPTNQNASFNLSGFAVGDIVQTVSGGYGTASSYLEVIVKDTSPASTKTVRYGSSTTGNYITIANGSTSQGVYGSGMIANITIGSGAITDIQLVNQGTGYKVGDILTVNTSVLNSPSGSGFSFTINGNNTGIALVSNISTLGGTYQVSDTLSVDPNFDTVGGGGGFQYTVTKAGFVNSVTVPNGGYAYFENQTLVPLEVPINPSSFAPPTTSGTPFSLSVATATNSEILSILYDGSISNTSSWSIDRNGNTNLFGGTLSAGATTVTSLSASNSITTTVGITSPQLTISSSASVSNLTTNGNSTISNAVVNLSNGTQASPALKFTNSSATGIYRDASDVLGISANGTARVKIGTVAIETTNDIKADSVFGATTPFFFVNTIGESVDIGAPATGLRINNDASIEAIGSDLDVDITFIPRGEGNLILTGGTNKDFSITDGSIETFRVDTESGNTTIGGRLDINGNIRVDDNIISNIGSNATTSFGQIITVSATGTGTGFTDGTFVAVTSTTNGSGTGATFNVTISGGDITAISVNAGGSGYAEGNTITLNSATIGTGSGKTITVTDIEGAGIVIKPQTGKNVRIDSTAMFVVPSGNTNQRPASGDRQIGGIRFNTQQQQFEGYNGTDFVSLGGVRDVNQDTYILTELSPGSNEDTFFFYNQGINSLDIVQDKFKLYTARTFETSGTLVLDGISFGSNPLDVRTLGSSVLRVRSQKDVEVTNGLRFKSVPVLGEIATIGTVTSGAGAYTPSQTFTAVTSTAQFEGSGATFTVVTDGAGSIQSVTLVAAGSDYEVTEVITIPGALLGGATPANNVTFPVATLTNTTAAFARLDILQQDYVTQLDSKPFLTLDANGAEAAWKINRGWNAGTESYLTVFDSTATFMELNDCRVEGGQLSSFGANATIVQFNKTAYKGAKTLVTIESNDGKVHMLEVTTVCAAAGTTAYATITNSVTSSNDLVDASVTVVGNNVNISIAKSSAATSSTSFTGRYTTTKVKV